VSESDPSRFDVNLEEEQLLDKDDYIDWEVDKLLLEINEVLEEEATDTSDGLGSAGCSASAGKAVGQVQRSMDIPAGTEKDASEMAVDSDSLSAHNIDWLERMSVTSKTSETSVGTPEGVGRTLGGFGEKLLAGIWSNIRLGKSVDDTTMSAVEHEAFTTRPYDSTTSLSRDEFGFPLSIFTKV